jgi:hypothetical protein
VIPVEGEGDVEYTLGMIRNEASQPLTIFVEPSGNECTVAADEWVGVMCDEPGVLEVCYKSEGLAVYGYGNDLFRILDIWVQPIANPRAPRGATGSA